MEIVSIAGVVISGLSFANDLWASFRDLHSWEEQDLPVDAEWPAVAMEKVVIPRARYGWEAERAVPTGELKGKYELSWPTTRKRGSCTDW